MKVILEPTVTVISKSEFIEHPVYKLPPDGDSSVKIGAFAAKGCYDSYGEHGRLNEDNQSAILEHRHGSVLEHITVGMFIEGITRSLTLELNRHRTFNISQRSTRYTAEEEGAIVLSPFYANLWKKYGFRLNSSGRPAPSIGEPTLSPRSFSKTDFLEISIVRDHVETSFDALICYSDHVEDLIKLNPNSLSGFELRKWARGNARNILPHNLETRGTWTNNLRGWRWFIELRSDPSAEAEIRLLAHKCLMSLKETFPFYFNDFVQVGTAEGIPVWKTDYSKV